MAPLALDESMLLLSLLLRLPLPPPLSSPAGCSRTLPPPAAAGAPAGIAGTRMVLFVARASAVTPSMNTPYCGCGRVAGVSC